VSRKWEGLLPYCAGLGRRAGLVAESVGVLVIATWGRRIGERDNGFGRRVAPDLSLDFRNDRVRFYERVVAGNTRWRMMAMPKFKLGQTIFLQPTISNRGAANGIYEVTRQLPGIASLLSRRRISLCRASAGASARALKSEK
jgi:hypothetical protein